MTVQLSEIGYEVLTRRYLKDETPDEMFWRVAKYIAQPDAEYGDYSEEHTSLKFYNLIASLKFLPNSPTLSNANKGHRQLSACYVLPVEDSIEGIFDAVKWAALIHRTGGGTGFDFSQLRPDGSEVRSTGREASGPISFMRVFDSATDSIRQGGFRRGANMGILRCDHPDIRQFIHMKEDGSLQNFNISVAATDEFMLEADYNPLFQEIAESAWTTGDPGLFFVDRANNGRANPVPKFGPIQATNPCGEMPLYPFDSCNLGSINLSKFVLDKPLVENDYISNYIDWDDLRDTVRLAVHFLDNVVDMNVYPLPECAELNKQIRRIGLGVMGWADMLFKLRIPYNSIQATTLAYDIMRFIQETAEEMTHEMAQKRGAFPAFDDSIYANGFKRRNSTLTSIAPTGTISMIAGASSGIEPCFSLVMKRQHRLGERNTNLEMVEVNQVFRETLDSHGMNTAAIIDQLAEGARLKDLVVPPWMKEVFIESHDIDYKAHIDMQAAFQRWTDNAVSKTINVAHDVTVEDVKQAYKYAYEKGCKGITIYRDGSKMNQVLSLVTAEHCPECGSTEVEKFDGCHKCRGCGAEYCG